MNEKLKALEYSQGKFENCVNKLVEEAYLAGYQEGYKDCKKVLQLNHYNEQGIEYIDLGLPSGTLWANDYLRKDNKIVYFTREDANTKDIASYEQWKELKEHCKFEKCDKGFEVIGPNGKKIIYEISESMMFGDRYNFNLTYWFAGPPKPSLYYFENAVKVNFYHNVVGIGFCASITDRAHPIILVKK